MKFLISVVCIFAGFSMGTFMNVRDANQKLIKIQDDYYKLYWKIERLDDHIINLEKRIY